MSEDVDGLRPLPDGFPMDFVITDDPANVQPAPVACPIQMRSISTGAFTLLRVEYQVGRSLGDYQVEPMGAQFTLREDELVRFDCRELRPLGIVTWADIARRGGSHGTAGGR